MFAFGFDPLSLKEDMTLRVRFRPSGRSVSTPSPLWQYPEGRIVNTALACTPFLCLDELHSWGSCQSQLWQLPPAPPLPVLMGTEQKLGWGGEGVSNSPNQQADCFALEPSTTYQAVEQPSSVKSTCKQVLPNTALACNPFLCHSWGSCQSQLWQLPPAPPLPNESAAFQAGLHTHQKPPIHVESCIKPTVRSEPWPDQCNAGWPR